MSLRDFLLSPPTRLAGGSDRDVFLSVKARYVRNLADRNFPWRSSRQEAEEARERILAALEVDGAIIRRLEDLEMSESPALEERGLVAPAETDEAGGISAVALEDAGALSFLINGINHIKISSWSAGADVETAFARARDTEIELDRRLSFAASIEHGYLCPRPDDCGSGLRLSALAFIPGISIAGVFERVSRDLLASGIEPRVRTAECVDASGADEGAEEAGKEGAKSLFVELSARGPLGVDEENFVDRFKNAMRSLAEGERKTRERVRAREGRRIEDEAYRAAAVLGAARLISQEECVALLGRLRTGLAFGLFPRGNEIASPDPYAIVDALRVLSAPGHIALFAAEREYASPVRAEDLNSDFVRAELVRNRLPRYDIG